jgi:hypothetical protein
MLDYAQTAVTALLWIITVWRAPQACRSGKDRSLWIAFAGVTAAMTLRPRVGRPLDAWTGITDLSFLLKHLGGGVVGPAALLSFLHTVSGREEMHPWSHRLRVGLPIATALAMVLLFAATPPTHEADDLLSDYAGHGTVVAYGVTWVAYLGVALYNAMYVCWQWGRESGTGALGWGLRIVGLGAALGLGYAIHRTTALLADYAGQTALPGGVDHSVSIFLLTAACLLIITGSTLPVLSRIRRWATDRSHLLRLYPLWHSLTEAAPSVRLDPSRSSLAERLDPRHIRSRLYRRTIEIRDASLALGDSAPTTLRDEARAYVAAAGLSGHQAAATVDACWLEAARRSLLLGIPTSGQPPPPAEGGHDLQGEIQALTHLASAYRSDIVRDFADTVAPRSTPSALEYE